MDLFFTRYMMIASFRMSWSLVAVFVCLEITFACLTAAKFTADPVSATMINKAGGWFGILCAWAAWYASAAVVIVSTTLVLTLVLIPQPTEHLTYNITSCHATLSSRTEPSVLSYCQLVWLAH